MDRRDYQQVQKGLRKISGSNNVHTDLLSRVAYGADAGCYSKLPQIVYKPEDEDQVIRAMSILYKENLPVTFRAAGTSLSGQSVSDAVLMKISGDQWSEVEVLDEGRKVRTSVGITGNRLNQILKPYNRKFGPDPASVNSALIGGIIANNASGMSCGIHANSYATIESARIIFSDGTMLDTADQESRAKFKKIKPQIIESICEIRDRLNSSDEFKNLIIRKYSIKNTTGYGLNSFIDFDDPFDILLHLMVGSEGTLGLITEAVFRTIPVKPFRASSIIYFKCLRDACNAVPALKAAGVPAIELIDREALRSVQEKSGIPGFIRDFDKEVTALLIDLEAETEEELRQSVDKAQLAIEKFNLVRDFEITRDAKQIIEYWKIRKGVFPSVGGMRKQGTVVIIEDIAVKMEQLTDAVLDLRELLDTSGYKEAVIYGHALDGNLHFIFAQDFEDKNELLKYENLIGRLTKLIVDKYNGSLKAEHGTGINMAPFVKYEWGEELYNVMKEIKAVFDPRYLLNPGVLINFDPKAHLKGFKQAPAVDDIIDKCIECGFCEINCLSTGYTLSARQRIVVQREIKKLKHHENHTGKIRKLQKAFRFSGDESCAGDGLCSTSCPVDIDTGVFIKKMRDDNNKDNTRAQWIAGKIARNFQGTLKLVRNGLGMVGFFHRLFGTKIFKAITSAIHILSFRSIPQWHRFMPRAAGSRQVNEVHSDDTLKKVVYFPSCISQSMGAAAGSGSDKTQSEVTLEVLTRAGFEVVYPDNMSKLCCGTPWESKGFMDVANAKSSELEEALLTASRDGELPVLCDTSPCIYRMKKVMDERLNLYEPFEFIHDYLLDRLKIHKTDKKLAFHITCSSTKMGLEDKFIQVVNACTENVVIPEEVGCCGFAGDKGFSQPALNDWALRKLKNQVTGCYSGYSNSRTCEIGLSKNSEISYQSIMYLVEEVSRQNQEIK